MNERSLAVDVSYIGTGTPGDGTPAASYKRYPIINEGSLAFNFNEATLKSFKGMGITDPWAILNKKGEPDSIEFAIPSPTAEECQDFLGGSIDANDKWEEPLQMPTIRKSLKINTLPYHGKYTEYIIVNGNVTGRFSQAPTEENSDLLLVKVTKMAVFNSLGEQKSAFSRQVKAITKTTVTAVTIDGSPKVGTRLTALTTPETATGTYQWYRKKDTAEAVAIADADYAGYTPTSEDVGCTLSVKFTGTDYYQGEVTSTATTAVTA